MNSRSATSGFAQVIDGPKEPRLQWEDEKPALQTTEEHIDALAVYGGKGGRRDWVTVGAWLMPGDVIAVIRAKA